MQVRAWQASGAQSRDPHVPTMDQESVAFQAVIVPHRSLSRRGLRLLMTGICVLCGVNAAVFVHIGAWPVGGFTGVELVLAAVLLRINARGARASELVLLTDRELRIVRTDVKGTRREQVLSPSWMSVRLEDRPASVPRLWLVAGGRQEEVGRSLGEAEKRDLAEALGAALHRWRNPRFDNPQLRD
jgi:uncharacterized membrane protein